METDKKSYFGFEQWK